MRSKATIHVALLVSSAVFLASPMAWAGHKAMPGRTVAVLEYRAGVTAVPNITKRLSKLLAKKTGLNVLGPTDARQRLGSNVDGRVAQCEGNPHCIARIGRRLHASEVILVGLTQLGNVIIDLARIQSNSGKILTRIALTQSPDEHISSDRLLGALRQLLPRSDFLQHGKIRVLCNLPGAEVFIGGKSHGTTPLLGPVEVLAPAKYAIKVKKKGYTTFVAAFFVPPKATITVKANLVPLSGHTGKPVYKKWWFWTALGAGTAALIAGAVVGAVTWHNAKTQPTEVTIELPLR